MPEQTLLYFLILCVFVAGIVVGSFLNVCVYRLPFEKSVVWPGSHCGRCFQAVRLFPDNVPLLSYLLLRGRCRKCGARFSIRYFLVELFTGLCFVGLFWLTVVEDVHRFFTKDSFSIRLGLIPWSAWFVFVHHAVLFCFLLVASLIDLDHQEIPLPVTITGTVVGLVFAVLFPWPWPLPAKEGIPPPMPVGPIPPLYVLPKSGLYPWPPWYPLPDWLPPGSWQTGLATGLAGVLAGILILRGIGFLFRAGRGKEGLGLGDADLMMMAGAFLGWQAVILAFFIAVFPGLVFGIVHLVVRGNQMLPFGPSLAVGVLVTMLGWRWIGGQSAVQFLFLAENGMIFFGLVGLGAVFLFVTSLLLRFVRRE